MSKSAERAATFKIVGNLLAEFGAGNLVILAFNDSDMAALRQRAKMEAKGDIGAFIRARIKKGGRK